MRSSGQRATTGLKLAAAAGLAFLHLPLLLIFLYAFTTEEKSYQFPPPDLTLKWFAVAWGRDDIWAALSLSVQVAAISTLIALLLGTLAAGAVARSRFFGRETISLLIILPIALPGMIAAFVIALVLTWNEYFFAALLTSTQTITLPVMVASQTGSQGISWWTMAAISFAAILPLIIVGILLERFIVRGMSAGAVK